MSPANVSSAALRIVPSATSAIPTVETIELSSEVVTLTGTINVSAPAGIPGTFLLDPRKLRP